ncbi:hypothetical protein BKA93DRAFT_796389 [Sparassis latifolia]
MGCASGSIVFDAVQTSSVACHARATGAGGCPNTERRAPQLQARQWRPHPDADGLLHIRFAKVSERYPASPEFPYRDASRVEIIVLRSWLQNREPVVRRRRIASRACTFFDICVPHRLAGRDRKATRSHLSVGTKQEVRGLNGTMNGARRVELLDEFADTLCDLSLLLLGRVRYRRETPLVRHRVALIFALDSVSVIKGNDSSNLLHSAIRSGEERGEDLVLRLLRPRAVA